jgi:hypothetical protein
VSEDPHWRDDERRWEPDDSSWRDNLSSWQPEESAWPQRDLAAADETSAWPDVDAPGQEAAPFEAPTYEPPPFDAPAYESARYQPEPDFPEYEPTRPDRNEVLETVEPEPPPAAPVAPPAAVAPPSPAVETPPAPEPPPAEAATPSVESSDSATAFNGTAWDPKVHGERRRPTTAEQAVPWLIGIILALAGIVIVLMALIFTTPGGLLAGGASPTPSAEASQAGLLPSARPSGQGQASPSAEASGSGEPDGTPAPTPTPAPEYGPLEMTYLGRQSGVAPVYLWRRDFSRRRDPTIMAQADIGVSAYTWSPDGRRGAAIVGERLVGLRPGRPAKPLAEDISAATFALDSERLYAVRIVSRGTDNVAVVVEIDFRSGDEQRLGSVRYPRPAVVADPPLREAQFIDDGGQVRLYATADGDLAVWILGAPSTYQMDTDDGTVTDARRQPVLWSPNGMLRVDPRERPNGTTNLVLKNTAGETVATTNAPGLVSHIRWVSSNNEIVFTLGTVSAGGGVRQDLYVWDLRDGRNPMPLTSNGVSFGAEWLGSFPHWIP